MIPKIVKQILTNSLPLEVVRVIIYYSENEYIMRKYFIFPMLTIYQDD